MSNERLLSPNLKIALGAAAGLLVLATAFGGGVLAGLSRSHAGYGWGGRHGQRGAFHRPMGWMQNYPVGQAFSGQITALSSSSLSLRGNDGTTRTVLVDSQTTIQQGGATAALTSLKVNNIVLVFGTANNQGQVHANLIRLLP